MVKEVAKELAKGGDKRYRHRATRLWCLPTALSQEVVSHVAPAAHKKKARHKHFMSESRAKYTARFPRGTAVVRGGRKGKGDSISLWCRLSIGPTGNRMFRLRGYEEICIIVSHSGESISEGLLSRAIWIR